MAEINCPKCGVVGIFDVKQEVYQGPFRCMGCRETFSIRIENNELKSCVPLNQADLDKLNIRKHYK